MKKILISLGVIGTVAAIAIGGTIAFFSDTETSQGNTFTAGAIDLQVDSHATYNGVAVSSSTWTLKDLNPTSDKFFNFADIKPGDSGENTISLHVINNDAWVCAEVFNLVSAENGCNEPELEAETGCSGNVVGELDDAMVWIIWKDDGAGGGVAGDNIHQPGEQILASGHPVNGVLPVYDSTTVGGALPGGSTTYLGVAWSLPLETGNEVQTDSLTGDISFKVVQSRNNENYVCVAQEPTQKTLILDDKNPQTWARISGGMGGILTYNTAGDNFNYSFVATGLTQNVSYSLIYYADRQDRFVDWGGDNPGALIGTFAANGSGSISTGALSTNLNMDLPDASDWNGNIAANYCVAPDYYSMCRGAKIWLVPTTDYDSSTKKLNAWNPITYLFETDLIIYNDTNN